MISFSQVGKRYRRGHEALVELSFSITLLALAAVLGWRGAYMSVSRHLSAIEPK
jgi:ABC-type ATPase involved in cell division